MPHLKKAGRLENAQSSRKRSPDVDASVDGLGAAQAQLGSSWERPAQCGHGGVGALWSPGARWAPSPKHKKTEDGLRTAMGHQQEGPRTTEPEMLEGSLEEQGGRGDGAERVPGG